MSDEQDATVFLCGVRKTKDEWYAILSTMGVDRTALRNTMHNRGIRFPAAVKLMLGNRLLMDKLTATIGGETKTLMEWAEINGTSVSAVMNRVEKEVPRDECVMPVEEYTRLLIKRSNERRYARAHGVRAVLPPRGDKEFIDFCLNCKKPARKCRGNVTNCMREKLIRELLGK